MKQQTSRSPMVGGTSLITIFAVLCLIVFTLLTLSTVVASRDLAERSHDAVAAYYAADSQAEQIFAQAEQIFAQLRAGVIPADVTVEGNRYCYTCPISDTQFLSVELVQENGDWNVIAWRTCSTIQ